MSQKPMALVFVLAVVAILLGACSTASTEIQSQSTPGLNLSAIQVKLSDLALQPDSIRIKAGETVQIALLNDGAIEHDLMVNRATDVHEGQPNGYQKDFFDGLNATSDKIAFVKERGHGTMLKLPSGAQTTLTFSAPTESAGEWEIGCFTSGHSQSGMRGTLIVESGNSATSAANQDGSATPAHSTKQCLISQPTPSDTDTSTSHESCGSQ